MKLLQTALILLLFSTALFSQETIVIQEKVEDKEVPQTRLEKMRELRERNSYQSANTTLEGPIDSDSYIVGPGDEFVIGFWGEVIEETIPVYILPEGIVYLPGLGPIDMKGLTLTAAREKLKTNLNLVFKGDKVTVNLGSIRVFKVYMTGAIEVSAEYIVNATTRVSTVIEQALGLTVTADGRNVKIEHKDGSSSLFDYWGFSSGGDLLGNPTLRDGDVIYVPEMDMSNGQILIETEGDFIRYYPFYDNETLNQLIKRVDFGDHSLDIGRIAITHADNSINSDPDGNTVIRNGDRVSVPLVTKYVMVHGEVRNPGGILWQPNRTASYYVGIAGKTKDAVMYKKYKLYRGESSTQHKNEDPIIEPGDIIEVPRNWRVIFREYSSFIATAASLVISAKAIGWIK